ARRAPAVDRRARRPGRAARGRPDRRRGRPRPAVAHREPISRTDGRAAVSRDDSGSDAEPVTDWRGIANEDAEVTGAGNTVLARRSRVLLGELVRPYRWRVAIALVLVVIENAAMVAGPLFVAHGLDRGIEAGGHGSWSTLAWVVGGYAACALAGGTATYCFYRHVGRLSQDVLFDLRVRAFAHAQRLDVAFH